MTVPEDQDPLLNTVLGGARIQRRVSAGLLANVYLGHYERLNVPVAVKVLSPKATSQGMNKERFVREGRALAQLSHQNIIKIYNVGQDNGRYFIVMDWIQDGMNLRQLAQSRPLTPVQSLKVARRLAEALDYIHQRSLIHRDIKPANVCLRKGGVPVLMDFSLIKDQSSDVQLTAPGTIMGTVNFMPPEQAQPGGPFGNVGPWSDIYSVGGTLYWLLTGRPPFKGRTPMETIIKLIREPHIPPSQVNPSVPMEVDALIAKALAKKSEERYQNSQQFIAAVDYVLQAAAEALARGTPPPLAADEDAPAAAPSAPAQAGAAPQASTILPAGMTPRWGAVVSQAAAGRDVPMAVPVPAARASSGIQPALGGPPVAQPMAAPAAMGAPGVPPVVRSSSRFATTGAPAGAAPPSPLAAMRTPSDRAQAIPPPPQPGPEQWAPTNGLDVPPDMEATVRLKGQPPIRLASLGGNARPTSDLGATRAAPPVAPPAPVPQAPAQKQDLKRSWVEDAPAAPSWTEQPKDPEASTLGMRRNSPGSAGGRDGPHGDEDSRDLPSPPPPVVAAEPEVLGDVGEDADDHRTAKPSEAPAAVAAPPRTRTVSERLHKAPPIPRRARRSPVEVALVALAVIVILLCIGFGSYVLFFKVGS